MKNVHTLRAKAMVIVGLAGLLLASCSSEGTSSDNGAESSSGSSAEQSIATSPPSPKPTKTSTTQPTQTSPPPTTQLTETSPPPTTQLTETSPPPTTAAPTTAAPTIPAGPPVFDPKKLGSNLTLSNFIVTITVANTNSGQLTENVTAFGYIKDPLGVYEQDGYSSDGTAGGSRSYFINGRSYEENNFGDWYLYEAGASDAAKYTDHLDLRSGIVSGVLSARFDGQADVAGIPANHFVFNETDLAGYSSHTPDYPASPVEGDFYLAQDGNYALYSHRKDSSPTSSYEVTEALSFIGQLTEIALPAELVPMKQALDLGVELDSLLPPGSSLFSMIRYKGSRGTGVDYYAYRTSVRNNDDFLNFYRTLPPTNGWTVTHIGHIRPHLEQINCETDVDCVILSNGGDQIVMSFDGDITLEYDHKHIFSPA